MALSLRAASGGNQAATSATSQAITLPTGTAANDLVYFIVSVGVGTVSGASATGWTLTTTNDATGATSTIVGYRTIQSGDTGPTVSWTNAGRAAWTAIALQPGAGNIGAHSGFATVTNTGATATTHTPGSYAAGAASGASVLLSGPRTSGNLNGAAVTNTVTTWTEPTNGDQSTASGNARQSGAWLAYRLAQTGTITPGAVTHSVTSFAPTHHAFAVDATAITRTITDVAGASDGSSTAPSFGAATTTNSSVITTGDTVALTAFTPAVGEILVAKIGTSAVAYPTSLTDNQGNTWTKQAGTTTTGAAAESPTSIWTATAGVAAATTVTATFNSNGSGHVVYAVVERYSGAQLAATPATDYLYTQAAISDSITTTGTNSMVAWVSTDWNVVAGTPTYLSGATESAAPYRPGAIGMYTAYQSAASPGSQTYGFSAPTGQWPSFTALEVQGITSSGLTVTLTPAGTNYSQTVTDPAGATDSVASATTRTITDVAGAADAAISSPISALISDFASMPAFFDGNFGGPAVTAGQLHVPTIGSYAAAATVGRYKFTGDSVYAQVVTASGTSGTRQNSIKIEVDSANAVEMIMDGGVFNGRIQTASSNVDTALGTYNATTHAWWRIRESAGTIFWDTSLDGTTWTNRGSSSHTLNFGSTRLLLQAGYYGTETAPPDAIYDNLNTPGSVAYSQTVTDVAGAADSVASATSRTLTDAAGAADTPAQALTAAQTLTDLAGGTDSAASSTARTLTDAAGATDAAAQVLTAAQTINDPAGATDSVAASTSRTLTDAAGATDSQAQALTAAQTVTDAAGAVDSLTYAVSQTVTLTDAAGASDTPAQALTATQTVTDPAGVADTPAQAAVYAPTVTDAAGATDSAASSTTRTLSDVAGAVDTVTQAATYAQTSTDPAGAVDTVTASTAVAVTVTDPAGASDTPAQALTAAQTVTDVAGATDSTASSTTRTLTDVAGTVDTASADATRTLIDPAGATDTTAAVGSYTQTVSDVAGVADTATVSGTGTAQFIDPVGAADTVTQASSAAQQTSDAAGSTDSVTTSTTRTLTDAAGAADTTAQAASYAPTLLDPAGAADSATVSGTGAVTLTDAADATDTVTQVSSASRPVTDAAGAADSAASSTTRTLTDAAGAVDTVDQSAAGATSQTITDAADTADTVTQTATAARTAADSAESTDTVTAGVSVNRTITDAAGAADAVAQDTGIVVVLTDAAGTTDTAAQTVAAQRVLADAAEIVDTAARDLGVALSLLDAIGAVDTAIAHAGELGWVYATRAPSSGLVASSRPGTALGATRTVTPGLTARRLTPQETL